VINWRRHNATGLQPTMMMMWAWAGVPLGVYNIVKDFNVALRIQPQILTFLSLLTWIQCYYYEQVNTSAIGLVSSEGPLLTFLEQKWSIIRSLVIVVPIACIMGGTEAALIIALRIAQSRKLQWPLTLMAVLSAVLLAAGVLRHYWDIYLHRTVRGISFLFVGIDAAGDVFSLVSIIFQPKFDVLGMVIYGTELLLWIGVFACGAYYNFVPWVRRNLKRRNGCLDGSNVSSPVYSRNSGGETGPTPEPVALHDLPSSTSVFTTPCRESEIIRQRNLALGGGGGGGGDDATGL
jgi:hypothetical protein